MSSSDSIGAEARAQVGNHIDSLRDISRISVLRSEYAVVDILQVPVVNESHQDSKAVQFARAGERAMLPTPVTQFHQVARVPLQSNIGHYSARLNQFAAPVKACRQTGNLDLRHEIVLLRAISNSPNQTGCHGFRSRLNAHLHLPGRP